MTEVSAEPVAISLFQVIAVIRVPGGSRSFRYSSIARMISFLTFSIVTSSRRWIPTSSLRSWVASAGP